jgi:hypothetical protein
MSHQHSCPTAEEFEEDFNKPQKFGYVTTGFNVKCVLVDINLSLFVDLECVQHNLRK